MRASGEFALGYVAVWGAFSLIATALQWGLDRAGLLSETMASGSVVLAALLLFAAGVYQLTPWKQACLRHCRSPLEFLTRYWRQGPLGPMRAGAWHGAFCLGCCWMLMGLLFVGGLMNLLWIAGLALLVLIEKLFPLGPRVSQLTGVGLDWLGRVRSRPLIGWLRSLQKSAANMRQGAALTRSKPARLAKPRAGATARREQASSPRPKRRSGRG